MAFADHFSASAAQYAAFRPTYPAEMVAWLAELAPGRRLAWDCGTGNGQAALLLARRFDAVLATDPSERQLAHAAADPRVRYRRAGEEASGLESASADLVVAAQALHWFDVKRFYQEAERVLRPDGLLAVWCYGRARVDGRVDPVLGWFHDQRVGAFWPPERRHVEAGYRTLEFPYVEIPAGPWQISTRMTREELLGYVGSWSVVAEACKAEGRDPLLELRPALMKAWPEGDEPRAVRWPLTLRVGRRESGGGPSVAR